MQYHSPLLPPRMEHWPRYYARHVTMIWLTSMPNTLTAHHLYRHPLQVCEEPQYIRSNHLRNCPFLVKIELSAQMCRCSHWTIGQRTTSKHSELRKLLLAYLQMYLLHNKAKIIVPSFHITKISNRCIVGKSVRRKRWPGYTFPGIFCPNGQLFLELNVRLD